jgi:hypothetical protein
LHAAFVATGFKADNVGDRIAVVTVSGIYADL